MMNPGEIAQLIGANLQIPKEFHEQSAEGKATVLRLLQSTIRNEENQIEARRAEKGDGPVAYREQRLAKVRTIALEIERGLSSGAPMARTVFCLCIAGYSMAVYHCPIHVQHRQDDAVQTIQVPKANEIQNVTEAAVTTSTNGSLDLGTGFAILGPDGTIG